jgi:spectinomycin phosphotransferase
MRTPPQDLTEAEVGVAVAAHWDVVAETIEYAPVGFGSHHWVLTGATGRRWFVTADAVADSAERLAELTAALTTAHALRHRCGLEFVVPPASRRGRRAVVDHRTICRRALPTPRARH